MSRLLEFQISGQKSFPHGVILMSFLNDNIKAVRTKAGLTQEEIADKLGIPQSTYATLEKRGNPGHEMIAAIAMVCGYKYADLIDEDFILKNQLQEPEAKYKKGRKSTADIKRVDAEMHQIVDAVQMKAMLRVMLRSLAELIAAQQKVPVTSVLKKMTDAVRAETSEEFDEL